MRPERKRVRPEDQPLIVRGGGTVGDGVRRYRDVSIRYEARDPGAKTSEAGDGAGVAPSSYDPETHQVDFSWGVGGAVIRRPWDEEPYVEELSMDPAHVRLGRANNGMPILDTHWAWSLRDILGSAIPGTVRVENGEGLGRAQLTHAEDVAGPVQRIVEGTARNGSVGFEIHAVVETPADPETGSMRRVLAVDWELYEFSFAPMGADDVSGSRSADSSGEGRMPNEDPKQPEVDLDVVRAEAKAEAKKEAREQERTAVLDMRRLAREHGVTGDDADDMIARSQDADAFRANLLGHLRERSKQNEVRPHVSVEAGADTEDTKRLRTMSAYLVTRFNPRAKMEPGGERWIGHSLKSLVREEMRCRNISTDGWSPDRLIGAEGMGRRFADGPHHGTADFPLMLADAQGKALRMMYAMREPTWAPFVSRTTVQDFKLQHRIQMGQAEPLEVVDEHGEFKRTTFSEGEATYRVVTAGRIIGLTRQALINDDLGGFGRLGMIFMRSVWLYENRLVWELVIDTAGAVFTAGNRNVVGVGSGGLYTTQDISNTSVLMRRQRGLDNEPIRIEPRFLLCPVIQQDGWQRLFSPGYQPTTAANTVTEQQRRLGDNIISEPLLDDNSELYWYLVADPAEADFIEVADLAGNQGVYTETRVGFEVDGTETKVRIDKGAGVIDPIGAARNAGE